MASQLRYGRPVQTVTSMRENQCSLEEAGGSVTLVDVPGHPRLRENIREKYAARAKSVVFVIESAPRSCDDVLWVLSSRRDPRGAARAV